MDTSGTQAFDRMPINVGARSKEDRHPERHAVQVQGCTTGEELVLPEGTHHERPTPTWNHRPNSAEHFDVVRVERGQTKSSADSAADKGVDWSVGSDVVRRRSTNLTYWVAASHLQQAGQDTDLDCVCNEVRSQAVNPECGDRKSTRLNSSHIQKSRMPSSA